MAMKTVLIASNNAHKVQEISRALAFPEWEFKSLRDMDIISDPCESASTFEGNARIKARAAFDKAPGIAVLADDSGLCVDALHDAPGVHSARYAGEHATDAENNAKLLAALDCVPHEKRSARFICTLVFIDADGTEWLAHGSVHGFIGTHLQGAEGFGYDPLFFPDAFHGEKTFAEVSQAEKTSLSHRGCALRALHKQLSSVYGERNA